MALTSIMNIAVSGLNVAQNSIRITSQNVANVNSPDYVRKIVEQEARGLGGQPGGVQIADIVRNVDAFLNEERNRVTSEQARLSTRSNVATEIQALFGRPDENNNISGFMDRMFAGFSDMVIEPDSVVRRFSGVEDMRAFGDELQRTTTRIQEIRSDVERDIATNVDTINAALQRLHELNPQIVRERNLDRDVSSLLEQQSQELRKISELIDIRTYERSNGFTVVTTSTGVNLLEQDLFQLRYVPAEQVSTGTTFNPIQVGRVNEGQNQLVDLRNLEEGIMQGELKGLLEMRDGELPNIALQLGRLGQVSADELNRIHNESVPMDAPNVLLGRESGLLTTDRLNFTGEMTILVTDPNRNTVESIRVDFDRGLIDNGGRDATGAFAGANAEPTRFAPRGFGTLGDFIAAFNTESELATMSFNPATGQLQILADDTDNGVVVAQDGITRSRVQVAVDDASLPAAGTGTFDLTVDGTPLPTIAIPAGTDTGAELATLLNGTAEFRDRGLTAYWEVIGGQGTLTVESVTDSVLSAPALTKGTFTASGFTIDEAGITPSTRGGHGTAIAVAGLDNATIDAQAAGGGFDFSVTIDGAVVNIAGVANSAAIDTGDQLAAALNQDPTFQANNLTARWHNDTLYIEHARDVTLSAVTFEDAGGAGTTYASTTINPTLDTLGDGTIRTQERGFSHFFGLNDLIQTNSNNFFDTGIVADENHNFGSGVVVLEVRGPENQLPAIVALNFSGSAYNFAGNFERGQHDLTIDIDVSSTTTFQEVLDALNDPVNGMGGFANFTLSELGQLDGNPAGVFADYDLRVLDDTTRRGTTAKSLSDIFGLGDTKLADAAYGWNVRADIAADVNKLSLASVESYMNTTIATTLGVPNSPVAFNPGNGGGAVAFETLNRDLNLFEQTGDLNQTTLTLNGYASAIIQQTSVNAQQSELLAEQRELVLQELNRRFEAISGVNMDEEMANLITYQNAYSASARVVTTVSEMFDTLLQL